MPPSTTRRSRPRGISTPSSDAGSWAGPGGVGNAHRDDRAHRPSVRLRTCAAPIGSISSSSRSERPSPTRTEPPCRDDPPSSSL
jgi:hypothetical protein